MFIRYTLLADGSSDGVLLPIIRWVIESNFPEIEMEGQLAGPGIPPAKAGLPKRAQAATALYECDVLFVHRDAERDGYALRRVQLDEELAALRQSWVAVIPVRMTEAWLLGNERAIRTAAGNPNGNTRLTIPLRQRWETLPDPKADLFRLLHTAANRPKRRPINEGQCRMRVAELTTDYSHLRELPSFDAFEADVIRVFNEIRDDA
ncbi:hypothetical protein I6H08_13890 [Burkholderia gladioli]|uniref:hypothetical protein n=1 Tax=Burkholderia gladioli TaxID=28095 RepID=UPI001935EEB3|nr:hypothetical protein [Burkholderia gladioli]QPQ82404.1 hypothetical protein I6H08_13890 [Burkholderia gladioli]